MQRSDLQWEAHNKLANGKRSPWNYIPYSQKYGACVVGLTLDEKGMLIQQRKDLR